MNKNANIAKLAKMLQTLRYACSELFILFSEQVHKTYLGKITRLDENQSLIG